MPAIAGHASRCEGNSAVLLLTLDQCRPGMTLAAPVCQREQSETILLKRGYTLEESILKRLAQQQITHLVIESPELSSLDHHLDLYCGPSRQDAIFALRHTLEKVRRSVGSLPRGEIVDAARLLTSSIVEQGPGTIYFEPPGRLKSDSAGHAVAVAQISILLGLRLNEYLVQERSRLAPHQARDVTGLAIAALLHDVGKERLEETARVSDVTAPPADEATSQAWQSHVRIGYELVRSLFDSSVAAAVLHHHQHFDGKGFPATSDTDANAANAGRSIHIHARIIHVADLYDRLVTPGFLDDPCPTPRQAIHILRTQFARQCDPMILTALQQICPAWPPGSLVTLADDSTAVVVRCHPDQPNRPMVSRVTAGCDASSPVTLGHPPIDTRMHGAPIITGPATVPIAQSTVPAAVA